MCSDMQVTPEDWVINQLSLGVMYEFDKLQEQPLCWHSLCVSVPNIVATTSAACVLPLQEARQAELDACIPRIAAYD